MHKGVWCQKLSGKASFNTVPTPTSASQSVAPAPAASAPPRNLLGLQIPQSQPRHAKVRNRSVQIGKLRRVLVWPSFTTSACTRSYGGVGDRVGHLFDFWTSSVLFSCEAPRTIIWNKKKKNPRKTRAVKFMPLTRCIYHCPRTPQALPGHQECDSELNRRALDSLVTFQHLVGHTLPPALPTRGVPARLPSSASPSRSSLYTRHAFFLLPGFCFQDWRATECTWGYFLMNFLSWMTSVRALGHRFRGAEAQSACWRL